MKKLSFLLLLVLLTVQGIKAQTPNQFKYQAVLRDASGNIIANQSKTIVIDILQGSTSGISVFNESHNVTTSAQGLINLNIGSVNTSGLANINWSANTFFIKITVEGVEMGTSQLLSVPYALHAKEVESINYSQIANTPAIPSDISNLTDTTNLLFNGNYDSLTNKPTNATTLKDGFMSYTDKIKLNNLENANITAGNGISITGTYPNLTVTNTAIQNAHYIGELYGGGIVFWVSPDGQHGLVMSLVDISTAAAWSNITTTAVLNANDMYDGLMNTSFIAAQPGHVSSAAKLCLDYSNGGYDDWYLPAIWQLSQIYHNAYTLNYILANDGNPATVPLVSSQDWIAPYPVYWSSTQNGSDFAWNFYFNDATSAAISKSTSYRVRAVRSF